MPISTQKLRISSSYIRKFKRKNKDGTVKTYYAEVESVREGKKVVQRHIHSLGTDPDNH